MRRGHSTLSPIVHIVGARPNFMKCLPVWSQLAKRDLKQAIIHTGQHYDPLLSEVILKQLGFPEPDVYLGVGSGSHARQTARLLEALERELSALSPRLVVVYGDVNSTLAAALVASKLMLPVAHVEAGLRSFDRSMPEEVNRVITDALSDLHLVTAPEGLINLGREGCRLSSLRFVGNPMIDTLNRVTEEGLIQRPPSLPEEYGVVTLHRPANVDDPASAEYLVASLVQLSELLPLVFPVHPRGRDALEAAGLRGSSNLILTEPMGYLEFVGALESSRFAVTDSGGVQEETTFLGVPCFTLRDNTERPVTVSMGTNRLVGSRPADLAKTISGVLAGEWSGRQLVPPLWDGRAGERIAGEIEQYVEDTGQDSLP